MSTFLVALVAIAVGVLVQLVWPGKPLYHYGWYNVALVALLAIAIASARAAARVKGARIGAILLAAFGAGVMTLTGIANGLLAPDNATIVGSPGSRVRVDDLRGSLFFPLQAAAGDAVVTLDASGTKRIGPRGRTYAGAFVLQQVPRDVVAVDVADARGAHLTMTQPTGSAFLSPVLTLTAQQTIDGMLLPYDSFAVPAAHRTVRIVYFDPRHAAMLQSVDARGGPLMLFSVDDESDRPLPHAIAVVRPGETAAVGGLRLRGVAFAYPAILVTAVPMPWVTLAALIAMLLGTVLLFTKREASTARTEIVA